METEQKRNPVKMAGAIIPMLLMGWLLYDQFINTNEPDWTPLVQQSSLGESMRTDIYELKGDSLIAFFRQTGFWDGESLFPQRLSGFTAAQIRDLAATIDDKAVDKTLEFSLRAAGAMLSDSTERHAYIFQELLNDKSKFLGDKNRFVKQPLYFDYFMKYDNLHPAAVSMVQTMSEYELIECLEEYGFITSYGSTSQYHASAIKSFPLPVLEAIRLNLDYRSSWFEKMTKQSLGAAEGAIELYKEENGLTE